MEDRTAKGMLKDQYSEMSPSIETSIRKLYQDCWILGSGMICERNGIETENCIASWSDDSGAIFRLREENNHVFNSVDASCNAQDRVHFAGTSAAVWKIGSGRLGVYTSR